MAEKLSGIVFKRQTEPKEQAFTLLVPQGWQLEGGVFRISPLTRSVQSISANVDLAVKSDAGGTRLMRFLPSVYYFDPRRMQMGMGIGMGMGMGMPAFGSNYKGMLVYPVMPPTQFLGQVVFPYVHAQAMPGSVEMLSQRERPDLVQAFQERTHQLPPPGAMRAGGEIVYRYTENGQVYTEKALGLVQDPGAGGAGMWNNLDTWVMRVPGQELEAWEPVFQAIHNSVVVNPAWQREEQQAQQIATQILTQADQAERFRAQRALEAQRQMQAERHEMVEHRRETFAEARNDAYLFLTGQEEYVNPYTGLVDTSTNQWTHRWVTSDGQEFYTNNESDNPNDDPALRQWEWQRTPVRPRGPAG